MFDKLTGVLFPPVLPLYFPQPFRSPSRGSFHAFPGLKFYFLSGFLKFFIFFQITCCNFQDFCYNSFCSGVWRSLVARSAGGREVAGSNPVTPTIYHRSLHRTAVFFIYKNVCDAVAWWKVRDLPLGSFWKYSISRLFAILQRSGGLIGFRQPYPRGNCIIQVFPPKPWENPRFSGIGLYR